MAVGSSRRQWQYSESSNQIQHERLIFSSVGQPPRESGRRKFQALKGRDIEGSFSCVPFFRGIFIEVLRLKVSHCPISPKNHCPLWAGICTGNGSNLFVCNREIYREKGWRFPKNLHCFFLFTNVFYFTHFNWSFCHFTDVFC